MYDIDKSKKRVAVIDCEIKALAEERTALYTKLQEHCKHVDTLIESPEQFTNVGTGSARLRICTVCWKTESDFFGYHVFAGLVARELSLEDFAANLSNEELVYWGRGDLHNAEK